MEATSLPPLGAEDWTERFTAALEKQRERVREFLSVQQERLRRAETEITAQLQHIAAEFRKEREENHLAQEELGQQAEQIRRQSAALDQMKSEHATRQAEWENFYHRAMQQEQAFAEHLKQQQAELAQQRQDLEERRSAAQAVENKLTDEKKALETEKAELEIHKCQYQTLAAALQTQQTELDRKIEREREELEKQKLQYQTLSESLQTRQMELDKREAEITQQTAETSSQRRRIAREFKSQRAAHLENLQRQRIFAEQAAAADHDKLLAEIASLREQCRILSDIPPPAEKSVSVTEEAKDRENLFQLYETANQELNDLRVLNTELQKQLAELQQNKGATLDHISPSVLDWEAEKQRILAALEEDIDEGNEEDQERKLEIDQVLEKTDRVVVEKQREINELRQLLETQTKHIGSMAVGAAAVGKILDNDPIIQEERIKLKRLQDEWREKFRRAEIELSLERAKIARERSQLEEKIRTFEQREGSPTAIAEEAKQAALPERGRWLARLGLKDLREEQNKP